MLSRFLSNTDFGKYHDVNENDSPISRYRVYITPPHHAEVHISMNIDGDHLLNGLVINGDCVITSYAPVIMYHCHVSGTVSCSSTIVSIASIIKTRRVTLKAEFMNIVTIIRSKWTDPRRDKAEEIKRLITQWLKTNPKNGEDILRSCYKELDGKTDIFQAVVDGGAHATLFEKVSPLLLEESRLNSSYITSRVFWEYTFAIPEFLPTVLKEMILDYIVDGFRPDTPLVTERRMVVHKVWFKDHRSENTTAVRKNETRRDNYLSSIYDCLAHSIARERKAYASCFQMLNDNIQSFLNRPSPHGATEIKRITYPEFESDIYRVSNPTKKCVHGKEKCVECSSKLWNNRRLRLRSPPCNMSAESARQLLTQLMNNDSH